MIAYLLLVGLIAQQFSCCCDEVCASVCHWSSLSKTPDETCECGHDHGCEGDADSSDPESDHFPQGHEHHHHLCVGAHIFYRTAARFDLSRLAGCQHLTLVLTEPRFRLFTSLRRTMSISKHDGIPLWVTSPSQAVLGVYQI